jgi:hypothetical protein
MAENDRKDGFEPVDHAFPPGLTYKFLQLFGAASAILGVAGTVLGQPQMLAMVFVGIRLVQRPDRGLLISGSVLEQLSSIVRGRSGP